MDLRVKFSVANSISNLQRFVSVCNWNLLQTYIKYILDLLLIRYHTIPYHTPYHTIPYHTIPYHTIPYHTIPYHTICIPYYTIPYYYTIAYLEHTIISKSRYYKERQVDRKKRQAIRWWFVSIRHGRHVLSQCPKQKQSPPGNIKNWY